MINRFVLGENPYTELSDDELLAELDEWRRAGTVFNDPTSKNFAIRFLNECERRLREHLR